MRLASYPKQRITRCQRRIQARRFRLCRLLWVAGIRLRTGYRQLARQLDVSLGTVAHDVRVITTIWPSEQLNAANDEKLQARLNAVWDERMCALTCTPTLREIDADLKAFDRRMRERFASERWRVWMRKYWAQRRGL